MESYYDNRNFERRKPCFHCGGKLIPTNTSNIISNMLIQIYECIDCGNTTKILEKPSLQTSIEPFAEPTIQESHVHPDA